MYRPTQRSQLSSCSHLLLLAMAMLHGSTMSSSVTSSVFEDGLPVDDLFTPGDINLGALVRIVWSENGTVCGSKVAGPGIQVATAIRYTVEQINQDPEILPGIELGTALLNDCNRPSVAVARAAKFVPLTQCYRDACGGNGTYKVVGVMGPYSSAMAKPVAAFLGLFEIPVISWSASSPEFSKNDAYKYFARTTPSDEHIIEAMVQILVKFKWTYVSVLYVAGARESVYMFKQKMWLQRKESNIKLCTALECELTNDDKAAEYAEVIVKLKEQGARVIVAFLGGTTTDTLLHALERNNSASDFIFIGTEGFQPTLAKKTKSRLPLRAFIFYGRNGDPEFKEYYDGLDPFRSATRGAWEGEYEPEALNCTRGNGTLVSTSDYTSDCPYRTFRDLPNYTLYNGIGKVTSIVKTYARALHRLIQAKCPGAKDDKTLLDNCILGPELFEYITNTSFITSNGTRVDYDKNGDVLGDYSATYTWALDEKYEKRLRKLAETKRILVRISDKGKIYSEADAVTWNQGTKNLSIDWELMPWSDIEVPESVCSEPCKPGFCTVIKEPDCCWKCKPCQVNEYVDGSNCISCEPNYWPNRNFTNCTQIDTTNMMKNAIGIVAMLIICAMFGLIKVTVLLWLFVRHWERKAIKGCTRELMVPIMVGLTMAYLTVFAFIYPPNDVICYFSYIGFNMSLCLLFGPLFLKTKRVHMIFQASDKCKQRVQNADSTSMIIGIVVIITIQVSLMVTTMVVATHVDGCAIRELPHMAMWNVKESESRCHLEPWVLLVPLCYNILLLLLCAVYGFLTRKLPENYNESWYIFIAVITTIFVWIACIPSYFVVKEAKYQVFLLSLALVVNAVVISICLFVPKIYVVYTIKDRDLRVSRMGSRRLSIGIDEVEPINSSRSRSFHRSKSSHSTNNSN